MRDRLHVYELLTVWTDAQGTVAYETYGRGHVSRMHGKPDLPMSSDAAFRGDGARHNPEDLLVASLSSCHMLWYLHLCADSGIVVVAYEDRARGEMRESSEGGGRFERVVLHPRVTIAAGDPAVARALHVDAHAKCFIANSVNFPVSCEPLIEPVRPATAAG